MSHHGKDSPFRQHTGNESRQSGLFPHLGPVDEMKRVSEAAYPISSTDQKRLRPELDFHDSPTPLDERDDDLPKAPKGWEPHREPTEY